MQEVTVKKGELLAALKANRETHRADFELAWDGFQEKAIHNFEQRLKQLKDLKRGQQIDLHVNLAVPQDHTEDYDRAIEMLDWEVTDQVTLTEYEFQTLVQDDWQWKQQFTMHNAMYTGSASPSKLKSSAF